MCNKEIAETAVENFELMNGILPQTMFTYNEVIWIVREALSIKEFEINKIIGNCI